MKLWSAILIGFTVLVSGCVSPQFSETPPDSAASKPGTSVGADRKDSRRLGEEDYTRIFTPDNLMVARISSYNAAGRFVVLECPIDKMPVLDQVLFVYRGGMKVGEIKVTGPARDNHTVADVIAGEAIKGDEVRDK